MPQSDQCISCRHYRGPYTCAAFPGSIPEEIITGGFDHSQPYPGDGGIRFEEVELDDDAA